MGNCCSTPPVEPPKTVIKSGFQDLSAAFAALPTSLHEWFVGKCREHGDSVALIEAGTDNALTYNAVLETMQGVAKVLFHNFEVRRGSRVSLLSGNSVVWPSAFQAILSLGAVASPLNPMFSQEDVAKHMELAGSTVLVTVTALRANVPEGVNALFLDEPLPEAADLPADYDGATGADDVIIIPFSSGTTGLPKGVQLTNRNLLVNILQSLEALQPRKEDVTIVVLPFFHIYGLTVLANLMMSVGATQVVMPRFVPAVYLQALVQHKATLLFVAPPILVLFNSGAMAPAMQGTDTSSVRLIISGAAPLSPELQNATKTLFPNAVVAQGAGCTETSPVVSIGNSATPAGSVGQLVANTDMRIVKVAQEQLDAQDATSTAAAGADGDVDKDGCLSGEMWVRGPQVMKGYLRDEDTALVFPEPGWFRTGDIVRIDELNNIFIIDRLKELIKVSGYQVAPNEIEGKLLTHPLVADTVVVSVPDPASPGNELIVAWVVLEANTSEADRATASATIAAFADADTVHYKRIKGGVRVVDAIPKSAAGKLLRRVAKTQEVELRAAEAPPQQEAGGGAAAAAAAPAAAAAEAAPVAAPAAAETDAPAAPSAAAQ